MIAYGVESRIKERLSSRFDGDDLVHKQQRPPMDEEKKDIIVERIDLVGSPRNSSISFGSLLTFHE